MQARLFIAVFLLMGALLLGGCQTSLVSDEANGHWTHLPVKLGEEGVRFEVVTFPVVDVDQTGVHNFILRLRTCRTIR